MKESTSAFVAAALFVALIAAFSSLGDVRPAGSTLVLVAMIGVGSHLALLPVVGATGRAAWARACGYSWIAIDVVLNVAALNGMTLEAATPFRLGAHVLAAVWTADAALAAGGLARVVGLVLAALLAFHAIAAPWIAAWVIFIPFVLIPVFLVVLGRTLRRPAIAVASAV